MTSAKDYPASAAAETRTLTGLDTRLVSCRACPRLVARREETARVKRAAFRDWEYWGRPVPGFGPKDASLVIAGLAPAAHGANRTGRMFTGDQAGDLLFATLHDLGLASRATATHRDDGLELHGVRVTAPVHCAPPANLPTTGERDTCRSWLVRELQLLRPTARSVVVLGGFGWQATLPALRQAGWNVPRPRPSFGHGVRTTLAPSDGTTTPLTVFGCYHVSRRNVSTRRLTPAMLREVLAEAAHAAGLPVVRPRAE
ncbi:uracil-DNA glycosylase [Streptomyces sp. NPDC050422]|uniref:uracil-DNA glycosylase n=1 Tax=Streptomyces sp. NPDC050422 TaxID=3365614 RepID=UPI0037ADA863